MPQYALNGICQAIQLLLRLYYQFAFKMETEAAARSPTHGVGTRAYYKYVEENDADTHFAGTRKVYT